MAVFVPKPTIKTGIVGKSNYTQTPTESQISSSAHQARAHLAVVYCRWMCCWWRRWSDWGRRGFLSRVLFFIKKYITQYAFVSPILPVYTHENINRVRLITSYILPFLSLMNMRGLSDIFDDLLWLFFIVLMLSFQPTWTHQPIVSSFLQGIGN